MLPAAQLVSRTHHHPSPVGRPAVRPSVHGRGDYRHQQGKHGGDSRFILRCNISAPPSTIRTLPLRLPRKERGQRLVNTEVDCLQRRGESKGELQMLDHLFPILVVWILQLRTPHTTQSCLPG